MIFYKHKLRRIIKETINFFNNNDYLSALDNLEIIRKVNRSAYESIINVFRNKLALN